MSEQLKPFDNLVKIGQLKQENYIKQEFNGLVTSAMRKLRDAKNTSLSIDSRFDLAYNAAHALSLAALRKAGYRSENRNLAEYEGVTEIETSLLEALIAATEKLELQLRSAN